MNHKMNHPPMSALAPLARTALVCAVDGGDPKKVRVDLGGVGATQKTNRNGLSDLDGTIKLLACMDLTDFWILKTLAVQGANLVRALADHFGLDPEEVKKFVWDRHRSLSAAEARYHQEHRE